MNYAEAIAAVEEQLQLRGYGFVVDQVHEELVAGKLKEERVNTLTEVKPAPAQLWMHSGGSFKSAHPAEYVYRSDYSEKEALLLLLEASKRATVEVSLMAAETIGFLREQGVNGLRLASDDAAPEILDIGPERLSSVPDERIRGVESEIDRMIERVRES